MDQSLGFEVKGKEHMVCKLHKVLYGLPAPRAWYSKIDISLVTLGLFKSDFEMVI